MCNETPTAMRKAISFMLKGTALSLFNRRAIDCESYEVGPELLRTRCNSNGMQRHLLSEWWSMCLIQSMHEKPNESKVAGFGSFVARLRNLKHQLHPDYHADRKLRDHPLHAVDIQSIQDDLRDHMPRFYRYLINGVANRLNRQKCAAGTSSANIAQDRNETSDSEPYISIYTLRQR